MIIIFPLSSSVFVLFLVLMFMGIGYFDGSWDLCEAEIV